MSVISKVAYIGAILGGVLAIVAWPGNLDVQIWAGLTAFWAGCCWHMEYRLNKIAANLDATVAALRSK